MIRESDQEAAVSYVLKLLDGDESERFEENMETNSELTAMVKELRDAAAAFAFGITAAATPSAACREKLLRRIEPADLPGLLFGGTELPIVVADADGMLQWINPAFTAMCGYALAELRGKKPGALLQGVLTDRATTARMGEAVRAGHPSREILINYRKDGTAYWVDCAITPVTAPGGKVQCFVALERELTERALPA